MQIMYWYPHIQTVSNLNASNPIYLKVDNDYVEVYDPFSDVFDFLMDFNSVVGDQIQINLWRFTWCGQTQYSPTQTSQVSSIESISSDLGDINYLQMVRLNPEDFEPINDRIYIQIGPNTSFTPFFDSDTQYPD